MPRLAIDYKKASIYEIVCKDINITERYVGSTTNLIKRRYAHKTCCNNEKCKQYNFYVYQFIRANGSFDNWDIVLIEKVIDCKDKEHLHKQERYYIEEKKAELNKRIPLRTDKEYKDDNKDKLDKYYKEYSINNKDKITEKSKKHYENNKDKIAEKGKEYREKNKDKIAERMKEYRENNKDKIAEQGKEYRENNRDKIKEYQKNISSK